MHFNSTDLDTIVELQDLQEFNILISPGKYSQFHLRKKLKKRWYIVAEARLCIRRLYACRGVI